MRTTDRGIEMIKGFEGLSLKAYLDSAGVPTIGYGHTKDVRLGDRITEEEAEEFLKEDLRLAEIAVMQSLKWRPTRFQFDALVSFVFNVGVNAFKSSTMLRKLNESDIIGGANEFNRWNKAGGKVLKGLQKRREKERLVFLNGYP